MQLAHIKFETCPYCGARAVSETQTHQHSNGQWFEDRSFACGSTLEWVPNYSDIRTKYSCPKSPEVIAAKEKLHKEGRKLIEFIDDLDIESSLKDRVARMVKDVFHMNSWDK